MGSYCIANFWRLHKKDILHYYLRNPFKKESLHNNLSSRNDWIGVNDKKPQRQKWVSNILHKELKLESVFWKWTTLQCRKLEAWIFHLFLRSTGGSSATDSYENDDNAAEQSPKGPKLGLVRLPFSRSGWDGVWSKVTKNSFPFTFRRVEIIISRQL